MKIIFNPPDNKENLYIRLMIAPLERAGFEIEPLDNFLSSYRHMKSIQLIHLNWFENIDDSSFFVAFKSFIRKLTVLVAIRLTGKPLVWTMHNRVSHEKGLRFFSRAITFLLFRWTHKIIVHSPISIPLLAAQSKAAAAKAIYIPHPHFIGAYGPIIMPRPMMEESILRLLFIGAVKPYKNIELVMTLAKAYAKEVAVTIAGKPINTLYKNKLEQLVGTATNIDLQLRFIGDEEIPQLLGHADLLVLPYDLASSLNSGTVLLAFSYKKSVICPDIGTIQDLGNAKSQVLTYHYSTLAEHALRLSEKIEAAIRLKAKNPAIFNQWGEHLFQHMCQQHANDKIGEQLIAVYMGLLNKQAA